MRYKWDAGGCCQHTTTECYIVNFSIVKGTHSKEEKDRSKCWLTAVICYWVLQGHLTWDGVFLYDGQWRFVHTASQHDSNVSRDGIYNDHNSMRGKSFFNSIIIFRGHQHICSLWSTETLLCSSCLYYNCCISLSRFFLPFLSLQSLAGTSVPTVWDSLFWPTLLQS